MGSFAGPSGTSCLETTRVLMGEIGRSRHVTDQAIEKAQLQASRYVLTRLSRTSQTTSARIFSGPLPNFRVNLPASAVCLGLHLPCRLLPTSSTAPAQPSTAPRPAKARARHERSLTLLAKTITSRRLALEWNGMSIWARWLLLLTALALFFHGQVIYLALYALLLVYVVMRQLVKRALAGLVVSRGVEDLRVFPGERTVVRVEVENRAWLPLPWLRLEEYVAAELSAAPHYRFALSVQGKSKSALEYTLRAKRRGVHRVGPISVETGDPFGIERFRAEVAGQTEVLVYPRVHPVRSFGLPSNITTGPFRAPQRHVVDPSRVSGIRDYAPGDPMRHVHWKATAHTGDFKVKKFDPMKHLDVAVVLDLVHRRYKPWNLTHMSELAIEITASLLAAANEGRQAFGFFAAGASGAKAIVHSGVHKGPAHLRSCLETLAKIQVTDREAGVEHLMMDAMGVLGRDTTIFLVTPSLDVPTGAALARLVAGGYRAFVIEVSDEDRRITLPRGVGYTRVAYQGEVAQIGS